jgi:uncharacterized protein YcbX
LDNRKKGYVYDITTAMSLNLHLEITAQLDELASRCSEELAQKRVRANVEPQDNNDDIPAICMGICSFMKSQGFSMFRGKSLAVCK